MTAGYVLRRVGVFFIVLWAAASINFVLPRLAPGDPVRSRLAESQVTGVINQSGVNAMVKAYDQQFGLDKPVFVQYLRYLWNCLHFDFGFSIASYPTRVADLIGAAIPWTAVLLLVSTLIAFVAGSLLGALAAWPRAPRWVRYISVPLMGLSSVPYYLIGLVLIYLFAVLLPIFPSSGGYSVGSAVAVDGSFLADAASHSILPALSIVISAIGFWALSMRGMMVSTSGEDFITFAEAKGLRAARIFFRYGVRNAILPQVTHLALSLGTIVSGSIIVEVVFGYPGVGTLLFKAVTGQDYFVVYGIVFIVVLAIASTTLVIDLVYPLIDPRITYRRS